MYDKGYGAVIAEILTGEGGACADAAYFTLYKDSFKLIAGKKDYLDERKRQLTISWHQNNARSLHMRGLAENVEPSRLNVVCWLKT